MTSRGRGGDLFQILGGTFTPKFSDPHPTPHIKLCVYDVFIFETTSFLSGMKEKIGKNTNCVEGCLSVSEKKSGASGLGKNLAPGVKNLSRLRSVPRAIVDKRPCSCVV